MIMIFYKPKNWEEFIYLKSHKSNVRLLNNEFINMFYHPDNVKYIKKLNIFETIDKFNCQN